MLSLKNLSVLGFVLFFCFCFLKNPVISPQVLTSDIASFGGEKKNFFFKKTTWPNWAQSDPCQPWRGPSRAFFQDGACTAASAVLTAPGSNPHPSSASPVAPACLCSISSIRKQGTHHPVLTTVRSQPGPFPPPSPRFPDCLQTYNFTIM